MIRRRHPLAAVAGLFLLCGNAHGQGLPTGGKVSAGAGTIGAPAANSLTITQTTPRAVINWQNFGIGQGNTVTVRQPNAGSAQLERVTGPNASAIAGTLSSNGTVYLVNPNGVQITPTGLVDTRAGFVASTLDISDGNFMAGNNSFQGQGGAVDNQGRIKTGPGGTVALLGGQVSNEGVISAPLGKVALGSGQAATVDANGDGFMQVMLPANATSADGSPLVSNSGVIRANGGTVELRAATVANAIRDAVNMPGTISARSVSGHEGAIRLDGGAGGPVAVSGSLDVSAPQPQPASHGSPPRRAPKPAASGGTISVTSGGPVAIGGRLAADGTATGGRIDVTGSSVTFLGADLSATGADQGGLVRIGGAFRGGAPQDPSSATTQLYGGRFGALPSLAVADTTSINPTSTIDVSASGKGGIGGTTIVWSSQATVMNGSIIATGPGSGGAVEISSKSTVQSVALSRLDLGAGGSLLLDPAGILIDTTSPGDTINSTTHTVAFSDPAASGTETHIFQDDLIALLAAGTNVTLQASDDLIWFSSNIFVTPPSGQTAGNLKLQAGTLLSFESPGNTGTTIFTGGGSWTLVSNETAADGVVDADRSANSATIDLSLVNINTTGGDLSLSLLNADGLTNNFAASINIGTVTANNFTASIASDAIAGNPATGLFIQLNKNVTAGGAVTLTGNLKVKGSSTVSGSSVNWTNASTATLTGSGNSVLKFVQSGVTTNYGVVGNTDAVRLALGSAGDSFTRNYGDADPTGDQLTGPQLQVTQGTTGTDLTTILAAGSLSVAGPGVTQPVASSSLTVSASNTFAFNSGIKGFFVDLTSVVIPLTINQRPVTPTVSAGNYTYGSPDAVVTLSNLVNGDTLSPVATLGSATGVMMAANGSGFGFAANVPAGTIPYTVTGLAGTGVSNYTLVTAGTVSQNLDIAQKPLLYSALSSGQTYGTAGTLPGSILTGVVGSDDVGGVVSLLSSGNPVTLSATLAAGTYTTSVTSLSGTTAGNYSISPSSNANGTYVVSQKTITYTTASTTSTYGTLAAPGISFSGVLNGDTVTGVLPFTAMTAVGGYSETLTGISGASAGNYQLATVGNNIGALQVMQKSITYVGAGGTITYGGAVPDATLVGVVSGDSVSGQQIATIVLRPGDLGAQVPINTAMSVGNYQTDVQTLTGSGASNYTLAGGISGNLTIAPKPLTFSIGSAGGTYGTLASLPTAALTGIINGDTVSGIPAISNGGGPVAFGPFTAAGSYTLGVGSLTGGGAGNYTIASGGNTTGTLTIGPLPINWKVADTQTNYGNAPSYSVTLTSLLNGDNVSGVVTATGTGGTVTTSTGIGTYTASVTSLTGPNAGNYALAPGGDTTGTLTIVPRPLTYSVANASGVYGTTATPGTVTLTGVVNSDSVGGAVSILASSTPITLAARTTVGSYIERVTGLSGASANYVLAGSGNTDGTLTIAPLPITFATANASSTYGTAASLATGSISGVLGGDAVAPGPTVIQGGGVPGAQQAAGAYSLVVSGLTGAQAADYMLTNAGSTLGTLTIAPKALNYSITVFWNGVPTGSSQTYGTLFNFGGFLDFGQTGGGHGTLTGVVGGDQVALTVGSPTIPTSTSGAYAAGTYTWTGTGLSGTAAGNYVLASSGNTNGVLKINPAPLLVESFPTVGLNPVLGSLVYGSSDGVSVQTAITNGLRFGDSVTSSGAFPALGNATVVPNRLGIGTYATAITSLSGPDGGNYTVVPTTIPLIVTPKPLTAQVSDTGSTYGTLASIGTATLTGVLPGDSVSTSVAGVFNSGGNPITLTARTPAGAYQMPAAGLTGANAANYTLLTLTPVDVAELQLTGLPTTRVGTLVISPLTLGFAVDPATLTQTYGAFVPVPALTGILPGDTVSVSAAAKTISSVTDANNHLSLPLDGVTLLDVGTYSYLTNPLSGASAGNYRLPSAPGSSLGTITINPKALAATAANTSTTYGTVASPTATFSGLVAGQTVTPAFTITDSGGNLVANAAGTDAGSYNLRVTGITGPTAADYSLGSNTATLTINPATLVLTIPSPVTATYGSNIQVGTLTGVLFGDDVGIDTLASPGIFRVHMNPAASTGALIYNELANTGTYTVGLHSGLTGAKAGDYRLSAAQPGSFTLTVQPKPLTFTVDNAETQYGGFLACAASSGCYEWVPGATLGAGHLTGILSGDQVSPAVQMLSQGLAVGLGATTLPGTYTETVTGLSGASAANYTLASTGNRTGTLTVDPAWLTYSTPSALLIGGSIASSGTGTTLNAQPSGGLLNGDQVIPTIQTFDPRGNPVTIGANTVFVEGNYTFVITGLTGTNAANYRVVSQIQSFKSGPFSAIDVGTLSVFANSGLGLAFTNANLSIPPTPTQAGAPGSGGGSSSDSGNDPLAPATTRVGKQNSILGDMYQQGNDTTSSGVAGQAGTTVISASASGIAISNNTQQIGTSGGPIDTTAHEVASAQGFASASPLGVMAAGTASANADVNMQMGAGYLQEGAQATVGGQAGVGSVGLNFSNLQSPSDLIKILNASVYGQAAAGVYVQGGAKGSAGAAGTGIANVTTGIGVVATADDSVNLTNGNVAISNKAGAAASVGTNASLSGTYGQVDAGATVYSPGVVGEQVQISATFGNGTVTLGLNIGAEIGIGGLDVNLSANINLAPTAKLMGLDLTQQTNAYTVIAGAQKLQNDPAALYAYLNQNQSYLQTYQKQLNANGGHSSDGITEGQYNTLMTFYNKYQGLANQVQNLITAEQSTQQQILNLMKTDPAAAVALAHSGTIANMQKQETSLGFQAQSLGVSIGVQNNKLTFVDLPPQ